MWSYSCLFRSRSKYHRKPQYNNHHIYNALVHQYVHVECKHCNCLHLRHDIRYSVNRKCRSRGQHMSGMCHHYSQCHKHIHRSHSLMHAQYKMYNHSQLIHYNHYKVNGTKFQIQSNLFRYIRRCTHMIHWSSEHYLNMWRTERSLVPSTLYRRCSKLPYNVRRPPKRPTEALFEQPF